MIVESHNGLQEPLRLQATRVLICDGNHTPVALFVQMNSVHVRVFFATDKDFSLQLARHGVDRTVLVSQRDLSSLVTS